MYPLYSRLSRIQFSKKADKTNNIAMSKNKTKNTNSNQRNDVKKMTFQSPLPDERTNKWQHDEVYRHNQLLATEAKCCNAAKAEFFFIIFIHSLTVLTRGHKSSAFISTDYFVLIFFTTAIKT